MADAWGVSFGGTFIVWSAGVEAPPTPVYGPPFISLKAEMIDTISNGSEMIEYLTFQSIIDEDS
jgi:hypothetical protein